MTTQLCQFVLYKERPTGKGKDRVWPACGKPAVYLWNGRHAKNILYCREHGEGMAGNFKEELKRI